MFQYGLDMNDMNRNHFDTLTHLNPYIEIKKKGRKFREIPSRAQISACGTPEAPSAQLAPTLKLGSSLDSTWKFAGPAAGRGIFRLSFGGKDVGNIIEVPSWKHVSCLGLI